MDADWTEVSDPLVFSAKPVVSVVMITYNHERFLREAIDSVVAQKTSFPFELVISEDCSTDGTRRIAIEYQQEFPATIRLVYPSRNVGPNRNFAYALGAARGAFIAVCEGDDYWRDSGKLQKQADFLNDNPDYVACFHDRMQVNEGGEILAKGISSESKRDLSREELMLGYYIPTLTLCFRALREELPDEFFKVVNADTFLISMLGRVGRAGFIADISPAAYRFHEGGVWTAAGPAIRTIKSVETFYWLSAFHKRKANIAVADKLIYAAMSLLHTSLVDRDRFPVRWIGATFFAGVYGWLRAIRSKVLM